MADLFADIKAENPNDPFADIPAQAGGDPFGDPFGDIAAQTRPEDQSFFREVADVPLKIGGGAAMGVRMFADAFGADNPVSEAVGGVEDYLDSLLSAQSKQDSAEVARIMDEAKDKGVWGQVKAGLKAVSVAPIDFTASAAGTALPIIAGTILAPAAAAPAIGLGLGATMGAGVVKSAIHEAVYDEMITQGLSEEQATSAAEAAQTYGGENTDQIALGTVLGAWAARSGIEPVIAAAAARGASRKAGEKLAETAVKKGLPRRVAQGAAIEALPEGLQGGQEQAARNIALQREGVDVPTMQGVVSQGVLEGAAGAILGGTVGGVNTGQQTPLATPPAQQTKTNWQEGDVAAGPDGDIILTAEQAAEANGAEARMAEQPLSSTAPTANEVSRIVKSESADASHIRNGGEIFKYTDPETKGVMSVVTLGGDAQRAASVIELYVPEESRGKNVGRVLLNRVMQDHPSLMGQVSSKAAATTAYAEGRRPLTKPDATLDEVFSLIDMDSSVNMATPNEQPLSSKAPDQKPFYSALTQTLNDPQGMPKKGTAAQYKGWLDGQQNKGSFKAEERDWIGLDDWLDTKGTATREEVQAYVADNEVSVEEVTKGDYSDVDAWWNDEGGANEKMPFGELSAAEERAARERYIEEVGQYESNTTKFSEYQLPGGENYRELLLTLPAKKEALEEWRVLRPNGVSDGLWASEEQAQIRADKIGGSVEGLIGKQDVETGYRSGHYDELNVLAHVRFNERIDADGKKVLFMEEIQSDWHQAGREKGYTAGSSPKVADAQQFFGIEQSVWDGLSDSDRSSYFDEMTSGESYVKGGVPNAPFKKTWSALAMKRMVKYAADNGFDRLAWATGTQQAERYDLSKQVNHIDVENVAEAEGVQFVDINFKKGDNINMEIENGVVREGEFKGKNLSDIVGKEVTDKINAVEKGTTKRLVESDLKVGGEGMKGFYDNMLVNNTNKFFNKKKWGSAKVGQTRIETEAGPYTDEYSTGTVWNIVDANGAVLASYDQANGETLANRQKEHYENQNKTLAQMGNQYSENMTAEPMSIQSAAKEPPTKTKVGVHSLDITPQMKASGSMPLFSKGQPQTNAKLSAPQIKAAVTQALSPTHAKDVNVVQSIEEVPGYENMLQVGQDEGFYDPNTKQIYLLADNIATEERAKWVAWHELFHQGSRVKFGAQLSEALSTADKNGTVNSLANAVAKDRNLTETQRPLAVEEAMAELNAAQRTGDYAAIQERYNVAIPESLQAGWRNSLKRFVQRLKSIFANVTGRQVDEVSDAEIWSKFKNVDVAVESNSTPAETSSAPKPEVALASTAAPRTRGSRGAWLSITPETSTALRKFWDKHFRGKGLLPEPVFDAKVDRDSAFGSENHHLSYFTKDLEKVVKRVYGTASTKLSDAQKNEMNNYLLGQPTSLDPQIRAALDPMRAYLDSLTARMISSGVVKPPETIQKMLDNVGTYMNRSYRAFDNPKWPEKVSPEVRQAAFDYLDQQRGAPRTADTDSKINGIINGILQEGTAADHVGAFIAESKLGSIDKSMLIRRKDIAEPIRNLLGEYKEPAVNFTRTATKMQRAIANRVFQQTVLDEGLDSFLFNERTDTFSVPIAGEGSEAMELLSGLYTTPEIRDAFKTALGDEVVGDMYRVVIAANAMVKYGKTVIAPTTMARNFISAAFFSIAGGHMFTGSFLQDLSKSKSTLWGELKNREGQREYYLKLKRLGVTLDNPYAGELIGAINDTLTDNVVGGPVRQKIRSTAGFFTQLYQYGDDFWKIIGFESEKRALVDAGFETGAAEVEAASRIRNTYPTYSLVGKAIKWVRRFPLVGTFVSFPAEIVRTSVNLVRLTASDLASPNPMMRKIGARRMVGMTVATGWAAAASTLSMALMGIDDDGDEAIRKSGAPWSRNSNLLYVGFDKNGLPEYFDISYSDPYNYLKRPLTAILTKGDMTATLKSIGVDIFSPFLGPDIASSAIGEAVFNQKMDGGRVYNSAADIGTQISEIAGHVGSAIAPGVVGNLGRIVKASRGDSSPYGKKYSLENEITALVGFRKMTLDPLLGLKFRAMDYNRGKNDAISVLNYQVSGQNIVSDRKLESKFNEAMRSRERVAEELISYIKQAREFGKSRGEIARVLQAMRVSKKDIGALMQNNPPRWRMTNEYMRNARDSVRATVAPADRAAALRELQRRIRLVRKFYGQYYR